MRGHIQWHRPCIYRSHALEQEKFKIGILEQSYSTQLRDERERAAVAEQSIIDQQTRIEELEADHKDLTSELAGVRARLEPFGPDPASIDELLESSSIPQEQSCLHQSDETADESVDPEVPDEMLAPDAMFAGKSK